MCRRSLCPRGFSATLSRRSLATGYAVSGQEAFAGAIFVTQPSLQCIFLHIVQLEVAEDTVCRHCLRSFLSWLCGGCHV